MRPSVIVSDLDGTLLGPGGALSDGTLAAVSELAAHGIPFILATGRSFYECKFVLDAIPCCQEMIGAAGALLSDARSGQTLARDALPNELVVRVTEFILAEGHLAQLLQDRSCVEYDYLLVGRGALHPTMDWWLDLHELNSHRVPSLEGLDLSHTIRIGVVGGPGELEALTQRIETAFGEELVIRHWEAVSETESQPTYLLELFNRGVDKWGMIEHVLERDGLDPERVVTIGDGLNDIQMLDRAPLGIAMGQARTSVQAVANQVVGSNREDGFAQAIRTLLRS
ncbi:MAG: hypothetical protein CBC35_04720 [Planctomycetes bacterium TMED75]|nr:hypothetical protein [Planctomycetaceae bacterium]OUU93892.1 MAG: hypothetical protein CBC35_04720 [Planctomycetes bacterium TMED75]